MKTKFLLMLITFMSVKAIGQNASNTENEKVSQANTITVNSVAIDKFNPDEFEFEVILSEYEHTDSETQQIQKRKIEDVENTFFDKIKELGIKATDCAVTNVYETNLLNNQNQYLGVQQNYNTTQKKILNKVYLFKLKDAEKIEQVLECLHFNGVTSVGVNSKFSSSSEKKITELLSESAYATCKSKATYLALLTGDKLGKVSSINLVYSTDLKRQNYYNTTNVNYNYYYNQNYTITKNTLLEESCNMTVVFTIE